MIEKISCFEITNTPIRVLKKNADIFADYVCGFFNESIKKSTFPSILKNANIIPVFKKEYRGSKENYRHASILQVIFKIFEKLLCKQITIFIDPLLSKYQCEFRKVLVFNIVYSQCLKNGKTLLTKEKCLVHF